MVADSPAVRLLALAVLLAASLSSTGLDLEPAFRLAAGGRPQAPPLLDLTRNPPAVWFLSEDRSLYVLSETGVLLARRSLPASPSPFLALDPFGRALVILDGAAGAELIAITRSGSTAWRAALGELAEAGKEAMSAVGADGRILLALGRKLLCLSATGVKLWEADLPSIITVPPAMDGAGDFIVALADRSVELRSPFGDRLGSLDAPGLASVVGAFEWGDEARAIVAVGCRDGSLLLASKEGGLLSTLSLATSPGASGPGAKALRSLASDGTRLFVLDSAGLLASVDGSGAVRWRVETGVIDGRIFLWPERISVTGKGRAVSLSRGGEVYRDATIRNAVAPGILSPSGLLFSAGEDWILAAYRFEAPLGRLKPPRIPPYPADISAVEDALLYDPSIFEGDRQAIIVADIEKRLDSGTIGGSEAGDRALLTAIASGSFARNPHPGGASGGGSRFGLSALAQSEACRVLGKIGAPASIDVLVDIAGSDADPFVRASAFAALGAIAVDPEGRVDRAFQHAALGWRIDEEVALALIGAIEAMGRRSGSQPGVEAARALLGLSGSPYGAVVRNRAMAVLGAMARGF